MTVSIPVSTVPQALVYFQNALAAQLANDLYKRNVTVFMGDPGIENTPDLIEIDGNVERTPSHFALVGSGGKLAVYEKYGIVWKVSSFLRGATQVEISTPLMQRAYQLVGYIETAVRTDPSFGGLLVEAWPGQTQGGSPKWNADRSGMLCELTGRVQCEAPL